MISRLGRYQNNCHGSFFDRKGNMEIKIVKMGINGEGIGYVQNKPTFVTGAFPDETVEIKIIKDNKTYQIAQCEKIIQPALSRVRSVCLNKECHTCPLIEMDYKYQLIYKQQLLQEALYKYAKIHSRVISDIVANPKPLGYRNQLKLPIKSTNDGLVSGMYEPQSNRFVMVEDCVVHEVGLETIKKEVLKILNRYHVKSYDQKRSKGLRYLIIRGFNDQYQCTLVSGDDEFSQTMLDQLAKIDHLVSINQSINTQKDGYELFGRKITLLRGKPTIEVRLGEYRYQLSPRAFFQLNVEQALQIYRHVAKQIKKDDVVIDAYSGIGSMTMFLQAQAKKVIGIENNSDAVYDANVTASINKVNNCRFMTGDAATQLAQITSNEKVNVLVLNPPRSGLSDTMLNSIIEAKIKKIVYVSCNPSTLAKNLDVLLKYYTIDDITPFDMFSYTPLVEAVVGLTIKGGNSRG